MMLPNFIVLGAQRSGTTLLHEILDAHEEIYVPQRRKELHYFDMHFDRGVEWYQSFFPAAAEAARYRAIGEVTPDYLFEPEVPARIAALLPECRLVAVLRNPVARAFSGYLHHMRILGERRSFAQFIAEQQDARERGFYARQIERYRSRFPAERMHVMIFEELLREPQPQLGRLAGFLGLSRAWDDPAALLRRQVNRGELPYFAAAFRRARRAGELLSAWGLDRVVTEAKRLGVTRMFGQRRGVPAMTPASRAWLEELYAPHIAELEALLGRPIEVWRKPASGHAAAS